MQAWSLAPRAFSAQRGGLGVLLLRPLSGQVRDVSTSHAIARGAMPCCGATGIHASSTSVLEPWVHDPSGLGRRPRSPGGVPLPGGRLSHGPSLSVEWIGGGTVRSSGCRAHGLGSRQGRRSGGVRWCSVYGCANHQPRRSAIEFGWKGLLRVDSGRWAVLHARTAPRDRIPGRGGAFLCFFHSVGRPSAACAAWKSRVSVHGASSDIVHSVSHPCWSVCTDPATLARDRRSVLHMEMDHALLHGGWISEDVRGGHARPGH